MPADEKYNAPATAVPVNPDDYETRFNELPPAEIAPPFTDTAARAEWYARRHWGPNDWLLEQEMDLVNQRRQIHSIDITPFDKTDSAQIFTWARKSELTGLCFSGGGIRSATFNLGVLQGMAARGWLQKFDYLSSVSGGGYIHSWLAGWLKRTNDGYDDPKRAWNEVISWLCPLPSGKHRTWPDQIQWLRRYSNYLTPRKGLLSGDTWAAFATWLRNVLLNQSLLLFLFLALLSLPHLLAPSTYLDLPDAAAVIPNTTTTVTLSPQETALSLQLTEKLVPKTAPSLPNDYGDRYASYFSGSRLSLSALCPTSVLAALAMALYLLGTCCIGGLLFREYEEALEQSQRGLRPQPWDKANMPKQRSGEFLWVCFGIITPLLLFGIVLSEIVRLHAPGGAWTAKVFLLLLVLVWVETFSGGARDNAAKYEQLMRTAKSGVPAKFFWHLGNVLKLLVLGIPAAATGTLLAVGIAALLRSSWMDTWSRWLLLSDKTALEVTLGTLLFFWLVPLTMVVTAGMIGKDFPDWVGEWLARVRAYTLVTGLGWICLCGCALLLPGAAVHLFRIQWAGWTGVGAWLLATFSGVLSGKSSKTSGEPKSSNSVLDWVAVVAPYIYIAGLALMLSSGLEYFRNHGWQWRGSAVDLATQSYALRWRVDGWLPGNETRWLLVFLFLTSLALLLGSRLDVNQFSMHNFYRNRLTRCYLGASNLQRNPSPVTGFDELDSNDLFIQDLKAPDYPGPIPIFCCALNMTTGEDLAWQERKAASFALAPAYSGFGGKSNGFVHTKMLYPGGPTVATAMATSGAAVSPNMGYHTQPATAFLLTMFDARLGLWMPNPSVSSLAGKKGTKGKILPASPQFPLYRLINELLGGASAKSNYVYVTDGGHFDNMGLYELVRRRCYRIVICDSEEDGTYSYEGIGNAIRKCRIDFGVEIDLDLAELSPNTESRLSPAHVVHGYIRYPETPEGVRGTITYIKASLTGKTEPPVPIWIRKPKATAEGTVKLPDVPGDVQNYKLQHADFPHDSTAEQWFTESQFESYRRLGQTIVQAMKDPFAARD